MKKIILILFLVGIGFTCYSQHTFLYHSSRVVPPDSLDIAYYSKKNGLCAAGQIFTINMGVWAFDRYALKSDFAYIDIHTIKANLKSGFVWDNDQMGTNMFLHPYHGNLYYNSARSNGYNYWASGLFAFGGSLMWELFMENEYPSANDIIATPIGGMAVGEVLYRASDLILDDRSRGGERFGREFAAFIITPTRGLTRLMSGDMWKRRATSGRQFGIPDLSIEISSGVRVLELEDPIIDKGVGFITHLNVEYGDKFNDGGEKPFDYFTLESSLGIQASQPILSQLNILGRLWVTDIAETRKNFLSLGFYQHLDYYDSDTISSTSARVPYRFSTPASLGIGFIYENRRWRNWDIDAFLHINTVFIGASLSDHYMVKDRNYNLGSGFGTKLGLNLSYKDKVSISLSHKWYQLYTWIEYPEDIVWGNAGPEEPDYQEGKSLARIHIASLRVDVKLKKQLYLTGIYNTYSRNTDYDYYDDVYSLTSDAKLMLTYKFKSR